jgi:hypothetical protein
MALDSAGNLVIAGSSQNAAGGFDYAVLKYDPSGALLWSTRYAPTNGNGSSVTGFALDAADNAYLTGSGGTLKVAPDGTRLWAAPYAANAMAVDSNGNVFVTGYVPNQFITAELNSTGHMVWSQQFEIEAGAPASSVKIVVGATGDIYVAGWAVSGWEGPGCVQGCGSTDRLLVIYDPQGVQTGADHYGAYIYPNPFVQTGGLAADAFGNVYLSIVGGGSFDAIAFDSSGQVIEYYVAPGYPGATGIVIDGDGEVFLTGPNNNLNYFSGYLSYKFSPDGAILWGAKTLAPPFQTFDQPSSSIVLDGRGRAYITGPLPIGDTNNNWLTVAYDSGGGELWATQYAGPGSNDVSTALVAAPDGSVYVTGWSANASGGIDLTTVKYQQFKTIEAQPGGPMILRSAAAPGQTNYLSATTNLVNWINLGPVVASTNGLCQYADTNYPALPHRFYRWHGP